MLVDRVWHFAIINVREPNVSYTTAIRVDFLYLVRTFNQFEGRDWRCPDYLENEACITAPRSPAIDDQIDTIAHVDSLFPSLGCQLGT